MIDCSGDVLACAFPIGNIMENNILDRLWRENIVGAEIMLYQKLIDEFCDISKAIIENNLTGIYLHGSLAMGCFNPEKSDIDLIVVIEEDITDVQKIEFMQHLVALNEKAPAKGLEISIVKKEYCKTFVYPTPFELHFSLVHLQWFKDNPDNYVVNMKGVDEDLAAHFTIINKHGIVLYGEPIVNIFGDVPRKYYIQSICSDVKNARQHILNDPIYTILNLCRVLAFLKEDLHLSKLQGGEWGIEHLSPKYHSLILQALDCYKTNRIMHLDTQLAAQFANDMLTVIREIKFTG